MSNFTYTLRKVVSMENCLGYPRPYMWGLNHAKNVKRDSFTVVVYTMFLLSSVGICLRKQ